MFDKYGFSHAKPVSTTPPLLASAVSTVVLTPSQFTDLYEYLCCTTTFVGFSAVPWEDLGMCDVVEEPTLGMCDVVEEPTEEPEGLRICLRKGQPLAVMEYDVGYRLTQNGLSDNF